MPPRSSRLGSGGSSEEESGKEWRMWMCRYGDKSLSKDAMRRFARQLAAARDSIPTRHLSFPALKSQSLDGIGELISSGRAKNIVVFSGAGMSTSAGIPAMYVPSLGTMWRRGWDHFNTLIRMFFMHPSDPMIIFEKENFLKHPEELYSVVREFIFGVSQNDILATPAHYFIRLLSERGILHKNITTNFDGLEMLAVIPEKDLVRLGGTFLMSRCLQCGAAYDVVWLKDELEKVLVPSCSDCQGLVKPDVVLFNELVGPHFVSEMRKILSGADLLIVLGSSLTMFPFTPLLDLVDERCPRLLVDYKARGVLKPWQKTLGLSGLDFSKGSRDVYFQGECDEACRRLADAIGIKEDLEDLIRLGPNDPKRSYIEDAVDIYDPSSFMYY